jgi:hypothetical protein
VGSLLRRVQTGRRESPNREMAEGEVVMREIAESATKVQQEPFSSPTPTDSENATSTAETT